MIELVSGRGSLWVLTCDRRCSGEARRSVGRVVRIDPRTGRTQGSARLADPGALAVGAAGVFATDFWGNAVRQLDPVNLRLIARVPLVLPFDVVPGDNAFLPDDVTVDAGAVWVLTARGALARVDPESHRVVATMRLPADATGTVQARAGAVWVAVSLLGVYRIDAQTNRVSSRIAVRTRDHRLAVNQVVLGDNKVFAIGAWTSGGMLQPHNGLARIDPARGRLVHATALPSTSGPLVAAFGAGSLWVARPRGSAIDRIDPNTGTVITHLVMKTNGPLAIAGGSLWAAAANGLVRRVVIS